MANHAPIYHVRPTPPSAPTFTKAGADEEPEGLPVCRVWAGDGAEFHPPPPHHGPCDACGCTPPKPPLSLRLCGPTVSGTGRQERGKREMMRVGGRGGGRVGRILSPHCNHRPPPPPPPTLNPPFPLPPSPLPIKQGQWWLFGLGFLCPLLWLVACLAPVFACKAAGSPATRAAFHNRSAVVAWSLSFTAALLAVILGSVAASMLAITSGHGNGVGGLGSEWVVGGAPLGNGAPLP